MQDIRFDGEVSAHGECSTDFNYSFPVGRIDDSAVIDCLECEIINCKIICNLNHILGVLSLGSSVPDAFDPGCRITFAGHCDIAEAQHTRCKCNGCIFDLDAGGFRGEYESAVDQCICFNIELTAVESRGCPHVSDITVALQGNGPAIYIDGSLIDEMASIRQCKRGTFIQVQYAPCFNADCGGTGFPAGKDYSIFLHIECGFDKEIRIVCKRDLSRKRSRANTGNRQAGISACDCNCSGDFRISGCCRQVKLTGIGNVDCFAFGKEITVQCRINVQS